MYISPHDNTETAADNKHGAVPLPFPQSILNYTSLIRRQYHPSFPIGMAQPDVFGQTFTLSARLTVGSSFSLHLGNHFYTAGENGIILQVKTPG